MAESARQEKRKQPFVEPEEEKKRKQEIPTTSAVDVDKLKKKLKKKNR